MVYTHTFAARMKKNTAITAEVIRSCWIDRQVVMESLVFRSAKGGGSPACQAPHPC